MYNNLMKTRRGRPWQTMLLLALFAWLLPQEAAAERFVEKTYQYMVMLNGANTIRIKAPVYDEDEDDHWVCNGNLYVTWTDDNGTQQKKSLLHFGFNYGKTGRGSGSKQSSHDNSDSTLPIFFATEVGGSLDITQGNSTNHFTLKQEDGELTRTVYENNDGETYEFSAVWRIPYDMLGKHLKFEWGIMLDYTNGLSWDTDYSLSGLDAVEIDVPSAQSVLTPQLTQASMSYSKEGMLEIPWFMATDKMTAAHYEYTDQYGKTQKVDLQPKATSDIIYLDATVPHNNFHIVVSYTDTQGYLVENISSQAMDLPVIHGPQGLAVRSLGDMKSKMELTWKISHSGVDDLSSTDQFYIQRSLTGLEQDFEEIGMEMYAQGITSDSIYTFVDSTLVQAIAAAHLKGGGTLDNLTYRVRRAMTENWGWEKNTCADKISTVLDDLHLLRIANYTANWEDERAYTVRVAWQYADEPNGVWDDRARMVLQIAMKNRDGVPVDTMRYELTQTEREQRYKVVSLFRPCVTFDVELLVERGESPLITLPDGTGFFAIHNADEWKTFRDKVEAAKGEYDVNARLYADISTDLSIGWQTGFAYRGTFDGNGHTLNFNITNFGSEDFIALFRHAKDYTIRNLHLKGNVKGARHSAALVGGSDASTGKRNTIENCHVSVTIDCTRDYAGGIIGHGSEAAHTIMNCLFDGTINFTSGNYAGAIIGWSDKNTDDVVINCLENGTYNNVTNLGLCFTYGVGAWGNGNGNSTNNWTSHEWAEANQVGTTTADELASTLGGKWTTANGAAVPRMTTQEEVEEPEFSNFFFPIRNAADWTTFRDKVEAAKGEYDVNARLYADITETDVFIGGETSFPYRGVFDGNGHTLTVKQPGDAQYLAPFRYVGNATIMNLHTAGTISTSKQYAAGLIANVIEGSTVSIENCRSSVTLKNSINGNGTNGGFIAVIDSTSNVTFRYCKFDGSFEGANCSHNGGFVGLTDAPVTIDNCLFDPAKYEMKPAGSATWARLGEKGSVKLINSYATLEFSDQIETIEIDGKTFMVLHNESEWLKFRDAVDNNSNTNAILAADFTVHNSIALDNDKFFSGIFDGNGHTLTAQIEGVDCIGLFANARDYTIKNLHVKGVIKCQQYNAGLVGFSTTSSSDKRNTITNCRVSATISYTRNEQGGFVGWSTGAHTITNCLFDGTFTHPSSYGSSEAAFIGWQRYYGHDVITNCLENGTYSANSHGMNMKESGGLWGVTPYCNEGNSTNNWTYHEIEGSDDLFYLVTKYWAEANQVGDLTSSELVSKLGSDNWQVIEGRIVGGEVVPIFKTTDIIGIVTYPFSDFEMYYTEGWTKDGTTINPETTTIPYHEYAIITKPILPDFYHASNGKIDSELLTTTRQSSVLLSWNTDGNPIDYFRVMRRMKDQGEDAWEEVATDIDQTSYEDTSVSPLAVYEYKVQAVNDCEGRDSTETKVVVGECKHTGRVEGYVRFNDGTGAPGIAVSVKYGDNELVRVETDESGYFEVDELSYQNSTSVKYWVGPVAGGGISIDPVPVTFDATSNNETLREFTIENGRRFSGYVMYDGTSIPVKGVNFLVDGNRIHNAQGKCVETDYDGSFSFRVLDGQHTIQAVMDKHVFTNDGWYKNSQKQNLTADVAGIYFYDATKVKLTGRIVGGNDQGLKPLDNNLSKNNLGDSLTMVLTLEGDNTSWLVYDNQHPNKNVREEVIRHTRNGDKHYTTVTTERKRMVVQPDATTGEYVLNLPPVRWKVQQIYCTGYPTLFQEGQVSEVIDLTDCLDTLKVSYDGTYKDIDSLTVFRPTLTYNAIYNRIYRTPVQVTYKQIGYDDFSYFGDKTYTASNLAGNQSFVPLAYKNPLDTTKALYTFNFPVFSLERKYGIQLQVGEFYQYNNDPSTGVPDVVRLEGGTAYMQNGMKAGATKVTQQLDSLGQTVFTLQADQVTQMLTGLSALKTVSFTVERDGTTYEAEPLRGYILNMFPLGSGRDILTEGQPILFDILRDPPGGYSSASLAKGSTINYSYMMNLSLAAGPVLSMTIGQKQETFTGTVQAAQPASPGPISGATTGYTSISDNASATVQDFVFNMQGSKAYSYTMALSNAVSTSGDPSMVGADADLYIGTVQNVTVTPMSTIRALPDSTYNELKSQMSLGEVNPDGLLAKYAQYGDVVEIAKGTKYNADGSEETFHLVRDLSLGYGPKLQSNFIYSQKQIMTQIIPAKVKEILNLIFTGTKADAQAIADKTKKPVYLSLRDVTDPKFALPNNKLIAGHAYNTTIEQAEEGINYLVVLPSDKKNKESEFTDEVDEKFQILYAWTKFITQNEHDKLAATDLVNNYDIAGAAGVNYSETYDATFSESTMQYFPFGVQPEYFETSAVNGSWMQTVNVASTALSIIAAYLESFIKKNPTTKSTNSKDWVTTDQNGTITNNIEFTGLLFRWSLVPVVSMTTMGTRSESKGYNRTETFTIATDPQGHLNVDVYRTKPANTERSSTKVSAMDVFTNYNFYEMSAKDLEKLSGRMSGNQLEVVGPRSFVYRTRGGSTQNPWEDKRVTQFYNPGTELDARTLKITNPKIALDKQSVSGVAIDDAARFTIILSNESEKPEATEGLTVLQLFSVDQANYNGAKISVNGQTLTTGGMSVTVVPGTPTMLQMEVRAGEGFDYEGLTIGVMSPTDPVNTKELVSFDVHFLREAGGVNIATPGDKWVLNTMAQVDSKRGWYIPVTINGFDRHQHNFDHIELQYKESQRGDDSWTNLCSYYAKDSLMATANGVRELIPENGNIVTQFYGEGWVIERTYDLRAVLFCRNGNDFLTTSSKVISGIKDTRRPQLFGTPEPKSGLLTAGDDIVFNFSEDIEYNYLSAITNFEVKGEVNTNSLSEMVSVQFDGATASVESEAKRNFSGKSLTIDLMVKPTETGRDMPLFSHGTNGQKLQLWLTSDLKLKAVVNDQTLTASAEMPKNIFQQVAMVLNQTDSILTLYHGGVEVGRQKLTSLYYGTGPLIFGRTNDVDRTQSQYYEGRMMEARLWYNAMDGTLIGSTYGGHHLTGYEKDLVDYYPMNEGSGDYVIDHTQGANAKLMGANWAIPRGLSLHVEKADKGVQLDKNAISRTDEQDYTLMFWFKTDAEGRGTLLSNGRGLSEDNGAENQFHIGFEDDKLMYRSNGFAIEVPGDWSDGQWHHYAMTVNRGRGVASIYMDKTQVTTFDTDSLGGISGGYPLIGASRYDVVNEKDTLLRQDGPAPLKGNVDELIFFAQALPQQLVSTYASKSPNGDEAGLLTYLGFDRQERQKDNSIELVPYVYSKKLYLDDQGKPRYQLDPETKKPTDTLVRDYLFVDDEEAVLTHFDQTQAAPVVPYEEVTNLKFSFIGRGNQVLVELDENAAKLNHRNIYVTLRDIEDLNGNTMASPQTACYYVTNSSLQWMVNRLDYTMKYGTGEDADQEVSLPFFNNGSTNHTYTIENCPRWLKLSKYGDAIAPQTMDYVDAHVSKDLNIGTYNEILYLTDEEGITEPFYLNLTIEGEQPEWAESLDRDLLRYSMNVSGQVYLYKELDTDARDIVGVFDNENVCHGFANISHDVQTGETDLFLTVYDKQMKGRELNFRLWQYSTGRELVLTPDRDIAFEGGAVLGTDKPVRFDGGEAFVQKFSLEKGWNWVSFNLNSPQLNDVEKLLSSFPWSNGDILTDMGSDTTLVYRGGQWLTTSSTKDMAVSPKKAYAIKVDEPHSFYVGGTVIKEESDRTILLHQGWNTIGYTPMLNLTVETALSDYYDNAQTGDVVKSHTEFAYFTKSGNTGRWRGSLQYMKPGEGYMLLRKGVTRVSFAYPFYELDSNFREDWSISASRSASPMGRSTMSVSASVEGFELEEGDRIVAYANGEAVGEASVLSGSAAETAEPLYITIGGDKRANIRFAIERGGEIVAASGSVMTFEADDVVGTPDEPFAISFDTDPTGIRLVTGDFEEGKWYTVNGVQLSSKPKRPGVYILNGDKVVIK